LFDLFNNRICNETIFRSINNNSFAVKEKAFLFSILFIFTAITGAGKYSIDNFIYKKAFANRDSY